MARVMKILKPTFHIVVFIFVSFLLNRETVRIVRKVERFMTDIRHLLIWTKLPGLEEDGQKIFINKNCQHKNCYLTTNRSLLGDIRYFDAIIFNAEDVSQQDWDLPKVRSHFQKYIFAANDSADNLPVCSTTYNFFFNWTWTYRLDSSIPYKIITTYNLNNQELGNNFRWIYKKHMKPISKTFKIGLQTKSRAAAVFLDECKTISKRETILEKLKTELAKYNLTVDVFGNCSSMKCNKRGMQACYYRLKSSYYFYLALESSMALDYITEIVLHGFKNNAVPIVYGGADYNRFLPPNSYLDVGDLGIPKLAVTMKKIIDDKNLYYEYFRWRNHYVMKKAAGMDVCNICTYLNNRKWLRSSGYYSNFRQWWNPDYRRRCGVQT